jgi:nucleotide-binding universal stress UspA family protein
MAYKAALTHVVADQGCESRLRMTTSIASLLSCEIIGVGARAPWPYTRDGGRSSEFEQTPAAARQDVDNAAAMFRETLKDAPIASSWRDELGYPDAVVAAHCCAADLVIAYPTRGDVDRSLYAAPDALVMESGLPFLLLPRREAEFRAERIVIGWKNTRETRRAISATLPLLTKADRILVAAICREADLASVEAELSDVAQRLARHGVQAATLAEVDAPGVAGRRLSRIAETDKSDIIVAGAYGHSRLREWVLGGVTRDLIADGSRYVLLSH